MRLRLWVKGGLQTLATIAAASVLYGLLMWMQSSDMTLEATLEILPLYLISFGAVMILIMSLTAYKAMLPLALSFGSTRREAFAGLQVFRLLPMAVVVLLLALLLLVPGVEAAFGFSATLLVASGTYLLFGAVGSGVGMVYIRFGRVGAILAGILAGLLLVAGVILITAGAASLLPLSFFSADWLPWLALALGAAVYLLLLIPEARIVRRYQIKS